MIKKNAALECLDLEKTGLSIEKMDIKQIIEKGERGEMFNDFITIYSLIYLLKRIQPQLALPYFGCIIPEWCEGVKLNEGVNLNNGLYSQCTNEKIGDNLYCKTCKIQAEKNKTGKPTNGNIHERQMVEYIEKKGKKYVLYSVVMKKLNITTEEAETEAAKFGFKIPLYKFPKSNRSNTKPKEKEKKPKEKKPKEKKPKEKKPKEKEVKTIPKEKEFITF